MAEAIQSKADIRINQRMIDFETVKEQLQEQEKRSSQVKRNELGL